MTRAPSGPTTPERHDECSPQDRKSTRLNSSHANISYAVFCLKKNNRVAVDLTAAATRWAADPAAEEALIRQEVQADLGRYRRIGHVVRVVPPAAVPVGLGLHLWVAPHADRGRAEAAVRAELGPADLPGGRRGLFHPDELTFGQSV